MPLSQGWEVRAEPAAPAPPQDAPPLEETAPDGATGGRRRCHAAAGRAQGAGALAAR